MALIRKKKNRAVTEKKGEREGGAFPPLSVNRFSFLLFFLLSFSFGGK